MSVSVNRYAGSKKDLYCVGIDGIAHCKGMAEGEARNIASTLSGNDDYIDNTGELCVVNGRQILNPNRIHVDTGSESVTVVQEVDVPPETNVPQLQEYTLEKGRSKKQKGKKKENE